ncbi:MAG: hypothetical protein EXR53_01000 [Dehalococcoidia bacterium]|nr:hypothetical protein [Dehalococcoidia bacterium]
MKITTVAWQGFAIPFRQPYVTSDTSATIRYGLFLFLHTDTGLTGVGEASPVGVGTRREVEGIGRAIAGWATELLGREPTWPLAWSSLTASPVSSVVRFGIETAVLDIQGKAHQCSLAEMLGGTAHPLPVNWLIAAETVEEAVSEAKEAVALGFTSLKLKVAVGSIEHDLALVASVREAVGTMVKLRIDPNQGWSVSEAIEAIRRLAPYGLEYMEQPVAAKDILGLREVRRAVSVPIAADEALGSANDMRKLLAADAADLFILKAGRLGGLDMAQAVMRLAADAAKPVVVTSSLESGVGIAASAHLASLLTSHPFAHGLATGSLLESDLLSQPLEPTEGVLNIPHGPGLGVVVDEEALERYSIDVKGNISS